MSKFSVYQAIYEVSQHEKTVKKEIKTEGGVENGEQSYGKIKDFI